MRTAREPRPLTDGELGRLLRVLELDGVPDRSGLQKHFSRLLKQFHPDRNRDRTDWAHEKTRAIIAANHRLRKLLDSEQAVDVIQNFGVVRGGAREPAYRREARPSTSAPYSGPTDPTEDDEPARGFPVQLVRGPLGNFALPVGNLERILAFDPELLKSLVPGEYVCTYDREVYRTYDLNGDPPKALPRDGYLILFRGERARFALLADGETRFEQIHECSARDLRRSFLEGHGELQLFLQTERYVFPARLRRML